MYSFSISNGAPPAEITQQASVLYNANIA